MYIYSKTFDPVTKKSVVIRSESGETPELAKEAIVSALTRSNGVIVVIRDLRYHCMRDGHTGAWSKGLYTKKYIGRDTHKWESAWKEQAEIKPAADQSLNDKWDAAKVELEAARKAFDDALSALNAAQDRYEMAGSLASDAQYEVEKAPKAKKARKPKAKKVLPVIETELHGEIATFQTEEHFETEGGYQE